LGRLRRTADQRDQPLQRVRAVTLLRAVAVGEDHHYAVLRQARAGELLQTEANRLGERRRAACIEAQLHGRRDFVDVLAARPGRADEALADLAIADRERVGDADHAHAAGRAAVPGSASSAASPSNVRYWTSRTLVGADCKIVQSYWKTASL